MAAGGAASAQTSKVAKVNILHKTSIWTVSKKIGQNDRPPRDWAGTCVLYWFLKSLATFQNDKNAHFAFLVQSAPGLHVLSFLRRGASGVLSVPTPAFRARGPPSGAEEACTGDGGRGGSLVSNVKNGKSEHFAQNVNLGSFQKFLDKMIARPGTGLGRVFCIGF